MKKKLLIATLILFVSCSSETREQKFWNWFELNSSEYFNNADQILEKENLRNELTSQLHKINENLVFEFSPIKDNGKREFTVSADGLLEAFPAVSNLVNQAPELDKWEIFAFRQRIPNDGLSIDYQGFKVSYSDIFFKHAQLKQKLGLELYIRDYEGNGHQQNAVFILLDALIGEYDAVKKIEWVEWNKLNESEVDNLIPFVELRKLIDSNK